LTASEFTDIQDSIANQERAWCAQGRCGDEFFVFVSYAKV